jgi:hypothetical protein
MRCHVIGGPPPAARVSAGLRVPEVANVLDSLRDPWVIWTSASARVSKRPKVLAEFAQGRRLSDC